MTLSPKTGLYQYLYGKILVEKGRKQEANWQRQSSPVRPQALPLQKIRFRFAIQGPLRFLSHLETMRVFTRSLRRAQLPVYYSQGFHPQPALAFATALPVGVESTGEYADVVLYERLEPVVFQERLHVVLPQHMRMLGAETVPLQAPEAAGILTVSSVAGTGLEELKEYLWKFLEAAGSEEAPVETWGQEEPE